MNGVLRQALRENAPPAPRNSLGEFATENEPRAPKRMRAEGIPRSKCGTDASPMPSTDAPMPSRCLARAARGLKRAWVGERAWRDSGGRRRRPRPPPRQDVRRREKRRMWQNLITAQHASTHTSRPLLCPLQLQLAMPARQCRGSRGKGTEQGPPPLQPPPSSTLTLGPPLFPGV